MGVGGPGAADPLSRLSGAIPKQPDDLEAIVGSG